ncbi:hypothetical protein [Microbispora hainanensis]|uniref:Uncharacterized protein n=1 Tax=Microbispora hainanensis TaxID=568844 RepID=A0A544YAW9_9ACTN|nr:hypothetical protein FLX08_34760 [Microbispora hainanensis]
MGQTATLAGLDLGIKTLGANPRKSAKTCLGDIDVPVSFGGVTFAPGAWLHSDEDAILLSDHRRPTCLRAARPVCAPPGLPARRPGLPASCPTVPPASLPPPPGPVRVPPLYHSRSRRAVPRRW